MTMDADKSANANFALTPAESPGGRIVFSSSSDGDDEIYVMNPDGTNLTQLTDDSAHDLDPVWSPDGTKIAFDSDRHSPSNFDSIYVMNADGTNVGRLIFTNSTQSAWSPDGSKIAFQSQQDEPAEEIYVMNSDGTGQTRLTNSSGYDLFPSWSLDGTKIIFATNRDGNQEGYVMNADGSSQANLTNNAAADDAGDWSPDGSRIAFRSIRDGNEGVYVMKPTVPTRPVSPTIQRLTEALPGHPTVAGSFSLPPETVPTWRSM